MKIEYFSLKNKYEIKYKLFLPEDAVKNVIIGVHGFAGDKESSMLEKLFFEPGEVSLSCRLVQQQSGCGRHVERIDFAQHRDHHLKIGTIHPEVSKSCLFCSDHDSDALCEVDVGVAVVGVRSGGKREDIMLFEPLFR